MLTNPSNEWLTVGPADSLKADQPVVIKGGDRPILVFRDGDAVRAVDNRCPHMGFPLSKGTIDGGLVTCYWHHARFDGESGCAFDLFADDVPAFDTKVEAGTIYVASQPRRRPTTDHYAARLERGLEQNIDIILAKSVIGLLECGATIESITQRLAAFGSRNHEAWGPGMVTVTIAANLWPYLNPDTRIHLLSDAARRLAQDCQNRPSRRDRHPLEGNEATLKRLRDWLQQWVQVRHRDGAERTALTVNEAYGLEGLNHVLLEMAHERPFADQGHLLDFINKLLELLGQTDAAMARDLVPLVVPELTAARGAEERSAWRSPIDLIALIHEAESAMRGMETPPGGQGSALPENFGDRLLSDDPKGIMRELVRALESGCDPAAIARELAHAAALRLAHFPESNDIADWFNPVHTFHFTNAVHQGLLRAGQSDFGALRGLASGAMAVYLDRFLNIPEAKLPGARQELETLPSDAEALLAGIMNRLDAAPTAMEAPTWVVRYLRCGHPEPALIDRLTMATLREDLDFHKIQCLEAAVRQASYWPEGSVEREHLYTGATRHLAAHCPTRRSRSKMTRIAIRLQRGELIHETEED